MPAAVPSGWVGRGVVLVVGSLLASFVLVLSGAAPAAACSCAATPLRAEVADADVVVVATVFGDLPAGTGNAVLDVEVEQVFAGEAGRIARIETEERDGPCSLVDLRAGDRRVLLVDDTRTAWPVGLCGGIREASPMTVSRLRELLGAPAGPTGPGLARTRDQPSWLAPGAAAGGLAVVVAVGAALVRRGRRRTT